MLYGEFFEGLRGLIDSIEYHVIRAFAVKSDDAVLSYNYRHSLAHVIEVCGQRVHSKVYGNACKGNVSVYRIRTNMGRKERGT